MFQDPGRIPLHYLEFHQFLHRPRIDGRKSSPRFHDPYSHHMILVARAEPMQGRTSKNNISAESTTRRQPSRLSHSCYAVRSTCTILLSLRIPPHPIRHLFLQSQHKPCSRSPCRSKIKDSYSCFTKDQMSIYHCATKGNCRSRIPEPRISLAEDESICIETPRK